MIIRHKLLKLPISVQAPEAMVQAPRHLVTLVCISPEPKHRCHFAQDKYSVDYLGEEGIRMD